ncbi:hypothetical protein CR513_23233, partial [Mucuna pruriens]
MRKYNEVKNIVKARISRCQGRSWVYNQGEFPSRSVLCWNCCFDVTFDKNNCGLYGIKCHLNWQCCRGLCRDIK